jgi:hypothetical protein
MTTLTMGINSAFLTASPLRTSRLVIALTQRMSARKDLLNCSKRNLKHMSNVSMVHRSRRMTVILVAFEHFHDICFGQFGHHERIPRNYLVWWN